MPRPRRSRKRPSDGKGVENILDDGWEEEEKEIDWQIIGIQEACAEGRKEADGAIVERHAHTVEKTEEPAQEQTGEQTGEPIGGRKKRKVSEGGGGGGERKKTANQTTLQRIETNVEECRKMMGMIFESQLRPEGLPMEHIRANLIEATNHFVVWPRNVRKQRALEVINGLPLDVRLRVVEFLSLLLEVQIEN